MLKSILTLDYEIHGNGEGCPYALMVEPTERMLRQFEEYGAKLTILADVAEIIKFKEYQKKAQARRFSLRTNRGSASGCHSARHDVQLHMHTSYFNARYEKGRWQQDWSEYNFAGLSLDRITQIVKLGKEFLESMLQPLESDVQVLRFPSPKLGGESVPERGAGFGREWDQDRHLCFQVWPARGVGNV